MPVGVVAQRELRVAQLQALPVLREVAVLVAEQVTILLVIRSLLTPQQELAKVAWLN